MEAKRPEGFPLLDDFSIPDGGVCGLFASEAALELAQTSDPTHEVSKDMKEDHELMVPTTDEIQPSYASDLGGLPNSLVWNPLSSSGGARTFKLFTLTDGNVGLYAEGQDWPSIVATPEQINEMIQSGDYVAAQKRKRAMRKQTITLEELGLSEEVVELPEYMRQEAIQKAFEICPWASRTEFVEGGIMCFESQDDVDLWNRQANADSDLPTNDVVPTQGRPTKAEDEDGGQSVQNDEFNIASLKSAFPSLTQLSNEERVAMKLAVMTDGDIAETPTDVLMDALDLIDNRRSGAEPTEEQTGYRTKILEELKNRGTEYKKASIRKKAEPDDDPGDYVFPATPHGSVEEAYRAFMDKQQNAGPEEAQENFDVAAREVGLGGQEIYQLEKRLYDEGFEVQAGRRPFQGNRLSGRMAKKVQAFGEKYPELDSIALDLESVVVNTINTRTQGIQSEMPYKAQYVLEELIKHLQADV